LLPPLLFLILFQKIGWDKRILTLTCYCLLIFLLLFFGDLIPRKILDPGYTLLEFSFFAALIFQQLKIKRQKILVVILSLAFCCFHIIYFISREKKGFDSIPIGIEAILIFVFIFLFFYEQLKDATSTPIYDNYFFWIAVGLFIYLGSSFFIYLTATTLHQKEIDQYWFLTYITETIKNLLLTVAIYIYSRNPNKTSQKPQNLPNLDFML
jgi:hypothetical protein